MLLSGFQLLAINKIYQFAVKQFSNYLKKIKEINEEEIKNDHKIIEEIEQMDKIINEININNYEFNSKEVITNNIKNIDINNFNFLRTQDFFTSPIVYDKVVLYFPSGFDFYSDYLGFYLNIYSFGYNNNTPYNLTNFYYLKSNTNLFEIFDLPNPFYYNEQYWVRSITIQFPSPNFVSSQRIVTNTSNEPAPNTINSFLTYGEGLASNSPIFIDLSFITSPRISAFLIDLSRHFVII